MDRMNVACIYVIPTESLSKRTIRKNIKKAKKVSESLAQNAARLAYRWFWEVLHVMVSRSQVLVFSIFIN
jgi:hypothetical protein